MYITRTNVEGPNSEWSWPSGMSDAEKDAVIQEACDLVDTVTRSHWEASVKTLYLSGDGTDLLDIYKVLSWPIVNISSIYNRDTYSKTDNFDTDGTLMEDSDYIITLSRRSIQRITGTTIRSGYVCGGAIWIPGYYNYRVIGTFGRLNTPPGIVTATKYLVRELVEPGSTSEFASMMSEKWADGYSYSRAGGPTSRNPERLTGKPAVDDILVQFVDRTPFMAVP